MSVTRNCEQCGKPFTASRDHARFCSVKCRVYWNRKHAGESVTRDKAAEPVTRNKRPKNWDGKSNDKRARELRAAKHAAPKGLADLAQFASEINKMCVVLEDYDIRDFDFTGVSDLALLDAATIYDDLVSLGEWHSRALSVMTNWLGDIKVRDKIAKLRDTTGRTPEEAQTALALADRLEAKLGAVLESHG